MGAAYVSDPATAKWVDGLVSLPVTATTVTAGVITTAAGGATTRVASAGDCAGDRVRASAAAAGAVAEGGEGGGGGGGRHDARLLHAAGGAARRALPVPLCESGLERCARMCVHLRLLPPGVWGLGGVGRYTLDY